MKKFGFFLLGIFIVLALTYVTLKFGGGFSSQESESLAALLPQLDEMGFYRYAPAEEAPALKVEALETGYLYDGQLLWRAYFAGSEDIAEGGAKRFLEDIAPFLDVAGFVMTSIEEDFSESGYQVFINGDVLTLWTEADVERGDYERQAMIRLMEQINRWLQSAGSFERIYLLYGGNEGVAVFLTPEMLEAIRTSGLFKEEEMPKTVVELRRSN